MKKMPSQMLAFLILLCLAGVARPAEFRCAQIDLEKVFDGYWKTKKADANIKEQAGLLLKDRKKMMDDWEKAKVDYKKLLDNANDQIVSSEERDKRKKAAEAKLLEIQEIESSVSQFDRSSQASIDEQKHRMRDGILKDIRDVINTKAKSGNFTMVMDVSGKTANQTPFVIYHTSENDLTDAVLAQLNIGMPRDFLKTLEPKEEKKERDSKK